MDLNDIESFGLTTSDLVTVLIIKNFRSQWCRKCSVLNGLILARKSALKGNGLTYGTSRSSV